MRGFEPGLPRQNAIALQLVPLPLQFKFAFTCKLLRWKSKEENFKFVAKGVRGAHPKSILMNQLQASVSLGEKLKQGQSYYSHFRLSEPRPPTEAIFFAWILTGEGVWVNFAWVTVGQLILLDIAFCILGPLIFLTSIWHFCSLRSLNYINKHCLFINAC